jgi:hypothetical protein
MVKVDTFELSEANANAFTTADQLENRVTATRIQAGQVIVPSMVSPTTGAGALTWPGSGTSRHSSAVPGAPAGRQLSKVFCVENRLGEVIMYGGIESRESAPCRLGYKGTRDKHPREAGKRSTIPGSNHGRPQRKDRGVVSEG